MRMPNDDGASGTLSRSWQSEGSDDEAYGTLRKSLENAHIRSASHSSQLRKWK